MVNRIKKKLWNVKYTIDINDYDNDILTVKGWIFSGKDKLEKIQIMIDTNQMKKSIPIKYGIKRNDVYQTFQNPYAKSCGFYGQILIENVRSFKVWLAYTKNKKSYKSNKHTLYNVFKHFIHILSVIIYFIIHKS